MAANRVRSTAVITHADYNAAYPLPDFDAPCFVAHVPKIGTGRVHRIATRVDSVPKPISTAAYIAALSTTEWRGTGHLANALDVGAQTAKHRMLGPVMSTLTEVRRVKGGKYEWRLKA